MEGLEPRFEPLRNAVQRARLFGMALCIAWPLFLMVLLGSGRVKAGSFAPVGPLRTLAFLFTGLSVLAAVFATWRTNRVMKGFAALAAEVQVRTAFRESVLYAALFELSCLYGLVYWMLVGRNAFQHVLLFMALTPVMFMLFVPRYEHWRQAAE